jgi:hypothetical protein
MNVKIKDIKGTWREVADAARTTINMEEGTKEPSSHWKKNMLLAEHSPIRKLMVNWKWTNLKYWISVQFTRHKFGIDHFVSTQRTDRTGVSRDELPQSSEVMHECVANAQAIINISRKRLCSQASIETSEAWISFLVGLKKKEPELYNVCVPECIYRGFCPELKSCKYYKTEAYKKQLAEYRKGINDSE